MLNAAPTPPPKTPTTVYDDEEPVAEGEEPSYEVEEKAMNFTNWLLVRKLKR